MSVAKCLGVDDFDAPNMQEVRAQWPSWANAEPALAVVDDAADVPRWMMQAEPADRDAVLSALRCIADYDARAFSLLVWLLVPGASLVAGKLRRLADAIDEVVAG